MTDTAAFLQTVLEEPDDDTPRLIYADWLEERGDPRAGFIRLQCEAARRDRLDPERLTLAAQARQLLERHEDRWRADLPKLPGITWGPFQRGFVGSVEATTWPAFRAAARRVFAAAPVQHLRFARPLPLAAVEALAASPHLGRLTALDLSGQALGPEGVAALARSPHLGRLSVLDLNGNSIRTAGLRALVGAPTLTRLGALYLGRNQLDPGAAEALAAAPRLTRLTTLALSGNQLGDRGTATLAGAASLGGLTTLFLGANGIGDEGAQALAATPYLTRLTTLDLRENLIGVPGAQALTMSKALTRVSALVLIDNQLKMAVFPLLRARFGDGVKF